MRRLTVVSRIVAGEEEFEVRSSFSLLSPISLQAWEAFVVGKASLGDDEAAGVRAAALYCDLYDSSVREVLVDDEPLEDLAELSWRLKVEVVTEVLERHRVLGNAPSDVSAETSASTEGDAQESVTVATSVGSGAAEAAPART